MAELEQRYKPRGDVRFRTLADEGVIVRQAAGEVVVLNAVGARVMELLSGGASGTAIVDQLEKEYDADRATLERDVAAHLAELLEADVIEAEGSAA